MNASRRVGPSGKATLPRSLTAARLAVYATFFVCGLVFAAWVSRIPAIKEKLAKAYLRQTALGKLLKKVKKLEEKLSAIPSAEVKPLPGKTVIRFMDAIKGMPADRVEVKRSMDDLIFLMYTGGTTGPAKGAMLTQRSYMCN
ncbi:MAG: AMP-binding protein, partial [Meiothermus silvanus]|nr:AMP-binding protein [Allomeiothermus silvanus]